MKIDSAINQITSIQNKGVKAKRVKEDSAASSANSVSDSVNLTDASSLLGELETQLSELPTQDSTKVDSIRRAINDGSFVVDEEAVAEGMVQESIEQLRHQRKQ